VSALTEVEIFDRLIASFREAAEHCRALAIQPNRIKGQRYVRLREHLMLIEGACRQASMWRDDARWLPIGRYAADCHKKCGDWLRFKTKGRMFELLAENMTMMLAATQLMKDRSTGVRGTILPAQPKYEPENRMVQVPSGLIVPKSVLLQ